MRKKTVIFIVSVMLALCGCSPDKTVPAGGGMVKNMTLAAENTDGPLAYEIPLISRRKLRKVTYDDCRMSGTGSIEITCDGMSGGKVWKGYYYYFLHFRVSVPQDEPVNVRVETLELTADGKKIHYMPDVLTFCNTRAYFESEDPPCAVGDALLYEDAPALLMGELPDDPHNPEFFSLEVNRDCIIRDFRCPGLLEISNAEILRNGDTVPLGEEGIALKAGDRVEIFFNLAYAEGVSDASLVKTSWYLLYEEADGKQYILEEPQGFMVFNIRDDRFVRNYIDQLIEPEPVS